MSRILRRPMFRGGGKVSSYGNGITAPLVDGYMSGGSINTPRRGLVSLPGGYAGETNLQKILQQRGVLEYSNPAGKVPLGSELLAKNTKPILTETESAESTAGKIDGVDYEKSSFEKMMENNQYGNQDPNKATEITDIEAATGLPTDNTLAKSYGYGDVEKVSEEDKTFKPATFTDDQGNKRNITTGKIITEPEISSLVEEVEIIPETGKLPEDNNGEELPEISARDAIKENQELFKELLGSKKARGQDISDMLLRFSGSEGNTLGEKFKNYTRAESAAGPGRAEKISQTASGLAINDYTAGKRAAEQAKLLTKKIDYELKAKNSYLTVQPEDNNSVALNKIATRYNLDPNSNKAIKQLIRTRSPGKKVYGITKDPTKIKPKDLEIGINIVTHLGAKTLIEKISATETKIIPFEGI